MAISNQSALCAMMTWKVRTVFFTNDDKILVTVLRQDLVTVLKIWSNFLQATVAVSIGPTAVERLTQWLLQTGSAAAAENTTHPHQRHLTPLKSLFSVKRLHPELTELCVSAQNNDTIVNLTGPYWKLMLFDTFLITYTFQKRCCKFRRNLQHLLQSVGN